MKPYYQKSGITLYNADCREVAKFVKCDFILSDVPYPDYYADEYGYFPPMFLNDFSCRQLIFWSAKAEFPLSYSAIHIWDKRVGVGSAYERIFERNGRANWLVFSCTAVNNQRTADYSHDIFYGHPSQKPVLLMRKLIKRFIPAGSIIFDPFSGSGSTLAAARDLGYQAVGCEVSEKWCGVTVERLAQQSLFTLPNNRLHLTGGGQSATQSSFTAEVIPPAKLPAKSPRR
jgi:site-specific DNA-methyltransferase (adenine-specific)